MDHLSTQKHTQTHARGGQRRQLEICNRRWSHGKRSHGPPLSIAPTRGHGSDGDPAVADHSAVSRGVQWLEFISMACQAQAAEETLYEKPMGRDAVRPIRRMRSYQFKEEARCTPESDARVKALRGVLASRSVSHGFNCNQRSRIAQ